ncbi:MAG: hypothetical protein HY000_12510 [Planctomycetes bacterium]|nr:hypothetical protein [Planctomycetota bacterium]
MLMSAVYHNAEIRFTYPEGWDLAESASEDGLTVNLQSPGSMFLFFTLYDQELQPQAVADQALDAMLEEYPDLDACLVEETIADQPTIGHDVNFFSLDLTNTCWIRAFSSGRRTVLIFAQTTDIELEADERTFQEICDSVEIM